MYVQQARTYVPRRSVCVYVDAANRYTASQHVYTARLHVLPREFSSASCTTMGDSFISGAPSGYRPGEGELTSDVEVLS